VLKEKIKLFSFPFCLVVDLCLLFSQPEVERSDLIRMFFQIELAHWFFVDFYCKQEDNSIYFCGIKHLAHCIFSHVPFLRHHLPNLNTILEEWRKYKSSVPTYGAILLTPDMKQCLLVQSFGKSSWSFPKGKVNENEDPIKCAIREVYEETGFDCTGLINCKDFIDGKTSNDQYARLYIVKNVPITTKFRPLTRNEIKDCSWFTNDLLPMNRNDVGYLKDQQIIRASSFYMIYPFITKLQRWINLERLGMEVARYNKKKQQQKQLLTFEESNKNQLVFTKHPRSPFFHNNVNRHARNEKQRSKLTGNPIKDFGLPGTFYKDNLKTLTPIVNNSPFMPSNKSADAIKSDKTLENFKKEINETDENVQQQIVPNGKHHDQFDSVFLNLLRLKPHHLTF
jgi:mRNA-decapping enzyme subunit 2